MFPQQNTGGEEELNLIASLLYKGVKLLNNQGNRQRQKAEVSLSKSNIRLTSVYMMPEKIADIKRLAAKRRLPLTRWIEEAIDSKIKKEDKKEIPD